jgi:hypothetical protein
MSRVSIGGSIREFSSSSKEDPESEDSESGWYEKASRELLILLIR